MSKLTVATIRRVHERLLKFFGKTSKPSREGGTTGALVAGLMSQNTSDHNRDMAYADLRRQFPDSKSVADAPTGHIAKAISRAGMMNQRAPRIKALLGAIYEFSGDYSADFLLRIPHERAFRWLIEQNGIAEKTAAVFLLFESGAPYFPVDTHIKRVLPRLGLFPAKTPALKIQAKMTKVCPPEIMHDLHLNILYLGRKICRPRNPSCPDCPLREICDFAGG